MIDASLHSESELRIQPRLVSGILLLLSVAGLLVSYRLADPHQFRLQSLSLLFCATSAMAWVLDGWKPGFSKWFMVLTLIVTVVLAHGLHGVPGTLALLAIPAGLAAALIGFPAAAATAVGESILLLLLPRFVPIGIGNAETIVVLLAIWAVLGLVYAVYRPAHQYALWSWTFYQQAQSLLEQARDRKADLAQALEDLTHANRQIALTNERLAAMRAIAEEAQRTKSTFVAKVSHEFRTPLNMIIGLTDLLIETPEVYGEQLPPALLEDLQIVHRSCEHLSAMINDVLDLSQAEAGRLKLHREMVNLGQVIEGALSVVSPLVETKKLRLEVHVPADLPDVYCDRTRIRQVILNLVSNAARFTEQGGITVDVKEQSQRVVVSVSDTGLGIPQGDVERIFEPFCQGTGDPWRDRGGSGLGLSISKQFVELHDGRISLASELGVGSTFSFDLPISPSVQPVAGPERWIKEDWVWLQRTSRIRLSDAHYKPRIVVCDEIGDLYPALSAYSDEVEFSDARSLAQVVQAVAQYPAHAVVLNTASPDNLWALVRQAKSAMPDTPIIGCAIPPQIERALEAGAMGYLIKPVMRADLEQALHKLDRQVRRVLVVDDSQDTLQLFTRMLYVLDDTFEVVTASNGVQALEEMRRVQPDVVLLDVVMPQLDGWQVLALKAQDAQIRDIPVIFLSAQDPAERPMESEMLVIAMGSGLQLDRILSCSLEFSTLMLNPG